MNSGITPNGQKPETKTDRDCTCKHCGNSFTRRSTKDEFCCNGCEYVHHLIHHAGFDRFYSLKGKQIPPVGSRAFQERELAWLETLFAQAEAKGLPTASLRLDLQGISCVGCVWLIEKIFHQSEGSLKILIQPQTAVMELTWKTGQFNLPGFAEEIQRFGYWVGPFQSNRKQGGHGLVLRIGLAGAFAMNSMLFTLPSYLGMETGDSIAWLFKLLTFIFATLSVTIGGSYFFVRSFHSLKRGLIHIDLPIALGIGFAYLGSVAGWYLHQENLLYFDFVSIFTFLMLAGRWAQEYAIQKNRNYLLESNPIPETVETIEGGTILLDNLEPGLAFKVKPGHTVPVNSQLISEAASINLEWINGESQPVQLRRFQDLPSGAMNAGSRTLEVRANETWEASLMYALLNTGAKDRNSPGGLNLILKIYLVLVLLLAVAGGMTWYFGTGSLLLSWQVTLSILVVSCPCALGVAVPLADEIAAAQVKRLGVFIKDNLIWKKLAKVRHIIFDKTGTLTFEAPELKNKEALASLSGEARSILYQLVKSSFHPKSRSLKQALLSNFHKELELSGNKESDSAEEVLGKGIILKTPEATWRLGRADWALASEQDAQDENTIFSRKGIPVASFSFSDSIREDAREELGQLRSMGYSVELLSGDHPAKVGAMLDLLDLPPEAGQGNQSPQQKASHLESLKNLGTLMVGDGANDSLAFDAALCCGTPVIDKGILESKSDFFFLGRKLIGIRELFITSRKHFQAQRDVFLFAISYNLLAVLVCLLGKMNPLLAAVLMPLSSILSLSIVALRLRGKTRL